MFYVTETAIHHQNHPIKQPTHQRIHAQNGYKNQK